MPGCDPLGGVLMAGYMCVVRKGVLPGFVPRPVRFNSNYEFETPLEQLHFTEGMV
jgi:hypothetical protein